MYQRMCYCMLVSLALVVLSQCDSLAPALKARRPTRSSSTGPGSSRSALVIQKGDGLDLPVLMKHSAFRKLQKEDKAKTSNENNGTNNGSTTTTVVNTSELQQVCDSVRMQIPLRTDNTISVKYEYSIYTVQNNEQTVLQIGNVVNNAVTKYLEQIYILEYCNNDGGRRQLAAGKVRAVVSGNTTLSGTCTSTDSSTNCYRLQSSNTVHFAPDFAIVSEESVSAAVLADIAESFDKDIALTASSQVQSASFFRGSIGTVVAPISPTVVVPDATEDDGEIGEHTNRTKSDNAISKEDETNKESMSKAGKSFLSFFIIGLAIGLIYLMYRLFSNRKARTLRGKPEVDDDMSTYITATNGNQEMRGKSNGVESNFFAKPKAWLEAIKNSVFDSSRGTRPQDANGEKSDRNIFISDTIETASTNACGCGPGTEVILEDLARSTDFEPHESPEVIRHFSPTTLPSEKERSMRNDDEDDNDRRHILSYVRNDEWSYDEKNFSLSDIQVLVDDASTAAGSMSFSKRTYYMPDTVAL